MVYNNGNNRKGKSKKAKPSENKGSISVKEAGRRGGNTTKARYGATGYYQQIGKKGGAKVRSLINAGKKALNEQ